MSNASDGVEVHEDELSGPERPATCSVCGRENVSVADGRLGEHRDPAEPDDSPFSCVGTGSEMIQ